VGEELDWGPKRPPAASWAGALLVLLGVVQLVMLATAAVLDRDAFLGDRPVLIVTASVGALFALQVLAAMAVLRLWRWWRGIAMVLCVLGLAVQVANLAGSPDRPIVVTVNAVLAVAYLLVVVLLARSRDAFA
jgi:peptidoglycan/LPS O-acetylase OafA/YrhL